METKKVDKYTFVNYPEQRTREDYDNAIKKIVDLHKGMEEVIALFRFGSISALGISDIDYFIVTKGEDMSFRYKCPHNKLTEKEKYLFQHYPSAIVPQRLLPQLHLLAPFFEIECIYQREGYSLDVPNNINLSKEEAEIFLADVIFMAYPRVFIEVINNPKLDVQKALKIIHSLGYLIHLSYILNIKKRSWQKYVNKGKALRSQWFKEKKRKNQEIISLLNEGLIINREIIYFLDQHFKKSGKSMRKDIKEKHPSFITRNFGVIFQEDCNKENQKKELILKFGKENIFISILPPTIAEHLREYTLTNTLFGDYVKEKLFYHQTETVTHYDPVKKERCVAMSELLKYTIAINYKQGAFTPFNLNFLSNHGLFRVIYNKIWYLLYTSKINRIILKRE